MKIDHEMARKYLFLLNGRKSIDGVKFNFITFCDKKDQLKYPRTYYNTYDKAIHSLESDNLSGFGVFVAVNIFKDETRQKHNIKTVRCVWQEDDTGFGDILFTLDPTIVVETSPDKFHRIFVFPEHTDFSEWSVIQDVMVSMYGSDPNAKDLTRVLRIPGYWHQKNEPFQSKLMHEGLIHTWNDIKAHIHSIIPHNAYEDVFDTPAFVSETGRQLIEIARIYSALENINPDIEYEKWLNVGMALHYESGGSEEGFHLWDSWSSRGIKYVDGECERKWKTFSEEQEHEPIRLGTLYNIAYDSGWDGHYVATGPAVNRYIRIQQTRVADKFWSKYRLIDINGKARFVSRENNMELDRIESRYYKPKDLKLLMKLDIPYIHRTTQGAIVKVQHIVDFIISNLDTYKPYKGIIFQPQKDLIQSRLLPEGKYYNSYIGLKFKPKPGSCKLIKQHIKQCICNRNESAYKYLMDYLAYIFQYPEKRSEIALVIVGEQGTGKSIIFDALCHDVLGAAGFVTASARDFVGDFNSVSCERVLVVSDEAYTKFDKRNNSFFKRFITGATVTKNEKFLPAYDVRNCAKLIMVSNMEIPVTVETGDRRFFFIHTNAEKKGDFAYFKRLKQHMDNGGLSAFIFELLTRNISSFHPRDANHIDDYACQLKSQSMIESMDIIDRFLFWHLENKTPFSMDEFSDGVTGVNCSVEKWRNGDPIYRSNDIIVSSLKDFYESSWVFKKLQFPTRQEIFIRFNKRIQPENFRNSYVRAKVIPPLKQSRINFERSVGTQISWDSGELDLFD